jgi:hypothetical protein
VKVVENNEFKINVVRNPDSLEEIMNSDPTTTLIFGGETELYKSVGFYYSFPNSSNEEEIIKDYSNKIQNLKESFYEFCKAEYNQNIIRESNREVGSANKALLALLTALKEYDYQKVADILRYSFNLLEESATRLEEVYANIDSDSAWELKAINLKTQYNELTSKYNKLTEEINALRKIESNAEDIVLLKSELQSANNKCADLVAQLSETQAKLSTTVDTKTVDELKEKLAQAEYQLSDALKEIEELKRNPVQTTNVFADSADADDKDQLIAILKKKLSMVETNNNNVNLDEELPIVTNQLHMRAKKVITIKEIKHTPYMIRMLEFFHMNANSQVVQKNGYRYLIVVFDNLSELDKVKYVKHGFAINEAPNPQIPIVITNNLSSAFLMSDLQIASYSHVIFIDRLGSCKIAVNRFDSPVFFLIDSSSDIKDYSLDPKRCIAFYDSKGECFIDMLPDASLGCSDGKAKAMPFSKVKFLRKLME